MQCPKCGSDQPDGALDCRRCGVVFAKLRPRAGRPVAPPAVPALAQERPAAPPAGLASAPGRPATPPAGLASAPGPLEALPEEPEPFEPPEPLPVEREGWLALGAGLVLALLLPLLPLLNFLLHPILTLSHELGHALFAWLFGYPAIPSFDFVYGGGLTHWSNRRHLFLVALPVGFLIWMAYHTRQDRRRMALWLGGLGLYLFLAFRLHWLLVLYMGHGFTLVLAGVFVYRALGGRSIVHAVERPLYAFLGLWMVFREMAFAYDLLTDPAARMFYREGKGGSLPNDFVRIAEEVLRTGLSGVARFHLFVCILVVPLAFLAYRYRNHAIAALGLRQTSSTE